LYCDYVEFQPVGKIWLGTNHRPEVQGQDAAIWDRVRLLPFNHRVPEGERDPHLKEKLLREAPGILAWAVRGCLDWQAGGLRPPDEVQVATADYRRESDVVEDFIEECCVVESFADCYATELYAAFRNWAEAAGIRPMKQAMFGRRLTEKGYASDKSGGKKLRLGLRLNPEEVRL
jgi:putative DNA primase/helicase